jgi:predicted NUDIX family phosphoesterase
MSSAQTQAHKNQAHLDERILVVKRSDLLEVQENWQGLNIDFFPNCLEIISKKAEFQPRSLMEKDRTYKQIIPYLIFEHEGSFFLMQRKKDASEQRLQSKYSLGIGGHMRFEDLQQSSDLFGWAKREFEEEVEYTGTFQMAPLGILNDDSTEVGQVHLGIVLMLIGDSNAISIKSELQSGQLIPLPDCLDYVPYMETWSQIVLMKLLKEGFKSAQQESNPQ